MVAGVQTGTRQSATYKMPQPRLFSMTWIVSRKVHITIQAINNGPLARYVKLWVTHVPGVPGTFSPPPQVSDPDMHHGTCVTHVPWWMPGSLTSDFLWSRWRGKRSRHPRCMRTTQCYVSGKKPMSERGWRSVTHCFLCYCGFRLLTMKKALWDFRSRNKTWWISMRNFSALAGPLPERRIEYCFCEHSLFKSHLIQNLASPCRCTNVSV